MNTQLDLSQFEGHTPGPWMTIDGNNGLALWSETFLTARPIARIALSPRRLRDSRLIAAAPELLAELRARRAVESAVQELIDAVCAAVWLIERESEHLNQSEHAYFARILRGYKDKNALLVVPNRREQLT